MTLRLLPQGEVSKRDGRDRDESSNSGNVIAGLRERERRGSGMGSALYLCREKG